MHTCNFQRGAIALAATAIAIAAPVRAADINLDATSTSKAGATEYAVPTITVTGKDNRYERTNVATLTFELAARIRKGDQFDRKVANFTPGSFTISVSGGDSKTLKMVRMEPAPGHDNVNWLGWEYRTLSVAFEYQDPMMDAQTRRPRDPVALCNDVLRSKSGEAREAMLRNGANFTLTKAYSWRGNLHYTARARGSSFDEPADIIANGYFPVQVRCQNLLGPAPRPQTGTRGAPPRQGKPLSETSPVRTAVMRIESSSKVVQARPGQLCPVHLRIVSTVTASRAFRGRALVFGSAFLSPPTALLFNDAGTRNFVVTYPLKWDGQGAPAFKATRPGETAPPLSQPAHLTLNVVDGDDKVIATSGRKTFDVVCKKMPPAAVNTR